MFFWPFDFSLSGFLFVTLIFFSWFIWSTIELTKSAAKVAGKVLKDGTVQEVGKGVLANWLDSTFRRR